MLHQSYLLSPLEDKEDQKEFWRQWSLGWRIEADKALCREASAGMDVRDEQTFNTSTEVLAAPSSDERLGVHIESLALCRAKQWSRHLRAFHIMRLLLYAQIRRLDPTFKTVLSIKATMFQVRVVLYFMVGHSRCADSGRESSHSPIAWPESRVL